MSGCLIPYGVSHCAPEGIHLKSPQFLGLLKAWFADARGALQGPMRSLWISSVSLALYLGRGVQMVRGHGQADL